MKNTELRKMIREEIKNALSEVDVLRSDPRAINNPSQSDLTKLLKKTGKHQEVMVFLKHSGKHRSLELVIHDEDQITSNKTYGHGTNLDGHEVEFKFSDVVNARIV